MTSRKLAACGLGFALVYALAALLGGGEGVAILSGSLPSSGASGAFLGLLYAVTYLGAVVASPILLFAAAVLRLRDLLARPVA